MNRSQQVVIDYRQEEIRVLQEQLGKRRCFNDNQRGRLAMKGRSVGRKGLLRLASLVTPDTLYWDQGTSPVLTENCVVIARMNQGESWLAAFDKATGRMRWKMPRNYETPVEGEHAYTTPLVIQHNGKETLLVGAGST